MPDDYTQAAQVESLAAQLDRKLDTGLNISASQVNVLRAAVDLASKIGAGYGVGAVAAVVPFVMEAHIANEQERQYHAETSARQGQLMAQPKFARF